MELVGTSKETEAVKIKEKVIHVLLVRGTPSRVQKLNIPWGKKRKESH